MLAIALLTLVGTITACGDDTAATTTMDMSSSTMGDMGDSGDMGDMEHEFAWGMPGDSAAASRVIEIEARDDFRFEPDSVTVQVGETVTFRVTNNGAIPHEFVVGTAEEQTDHEAEMADMGGMEMADEPNAINLEPGETKDLTLTFTQAGALKFGCHETGHFAAGMVGDLTVEG